MPEANITVKTTNDTYLDDLKKAKEAAELEKNQALARQTSASSSLTLALEYEGLLKKYIETVDASQKLQAKIETSLKASKTLTGNTILNVGYTKEALEILMVDIYLIAQSTETILGQLGDKHPNGLKKQLEDVENTDEIKKSLDKLIDSYSEALDAATKALTDVLTAHRDLMQLTAFFPKSDLNKPFARTPITNVPGSIPGSIGFMLAKSIKSDEGDDSHQNQVEAFVKYFNHLEKTKEEAKTNSMNAAANLAEATTAKDAAEAKFDAIKASFDAATKANDT